MILPALIPITLEAIHQGLTRNVAFEEAKRLSNGKGIMNIGAGPHRIFWAQEVAEDPDVLTNVDIVPDGMPNFYQLDIETEVLPFRNKQFGCAFASHVLEHLDNWEFALNEMLRVADHVVIVFPDPRFFSGWVVPEHKQHFPLDDMRAMTELFPNVEVYC